MADQITEVAEAIASVLRTATGLRVYPFTPANPELSSIWMLAPRDVTYNKAFGRGLAEMTLVVSAGVKRWDEESGQIKLRELALSIPAALWADVTLNGKCSRLRVLRSDLGVQVIAGSQTPVLDLEVNIAF